MRRIGVRRATNPSGQTYPCGVGGLSLEIHPGETAHLLGGIDQQDVARLDIAGEGRQLVARQLGARFIEADQMRLPPALAQYRVQSFKKSRLTEAMRTDEKRRLISEENWLVYSRHD